MRHIALTISLAGLAACGDPNTPMTADNRETTTDGWETPARRPTNIEACDITADPLVHPVVRKMREQSIWRLAETSFVELDDAEAANLIRADHGDSFASASSLMNAYLGDLSEQKHNAVVERRGSWSGATEAEYSALSQRNAAGEFDRYRPFLVRAVARHENTGHFYASRCGPDLFIEHGSLGRSVPPSIKTPLVVFLPEPPRQVYVTWSIAE